MTFDLSTHERLPGSLARMDDRSTVIIGGGIVGLATALAIHRRDPDASITVIEKESGPAAHQTGRNSGVIHAGVYYKPGSEKAKMCTAGREAMVEFAKEHGIDHEVCGKLVVATEESERGRMMDLADRCKANNVPVQLLGPAEMRDREPNVAGIAALWVSVTGIIDYGQVSWKMLDLLRAGGVDVRFNEEVVGGRSIGNDVTIETTRSTIHSSRLVNCGGLHADRIARTLGADANDVRIIPFRGEYFELEHSKSHLVKGLIYPVPDPQFPFLGVHLTRGINGHIHAGPNAVLGFAREGYTWGAINPKDLAETLVFPGFRKLAAKQWRYGLSEMKRSLHTPEFARSLQRLVPAVQLEDLKPAPAGVRAQAVRSDGSLVDDFLFRVSGRGLHVLNAPSPAATASLAIGSAIADRLDEISDR